MAKQKLNKTNAMRELDAAGIEYEWAEYDYDESDLSGEHAAAELGVSEDEMFKTLVTRGDNNLLSVFVLPVSGTLDLKKAAVASGNKKVEMIHVKEINDLTGYLRGGCSPIGMKKKYPTYIDETAILFDKIYFSAGKRGMQIILDPNILAEFVDAKFVNLVK
ncbi:MAG: Cys-tRNA(Pro) deacylase [Clostridiales bacterium]|nr:Cys-tRNA(Pro) deacylase [Candidatus Crickella equi]